MSTWGRITSADAENRPIHWRTRPPRPCARSPPGSGRCLSVTFRATADSVAAGIFTLSPEGRVVYMNQAAEDLLGWSLPELAGRVMHPIVHSRTSDGSPLAIQDCPIMRAGRNGDIVRGEDEVFTRQDGSRFPVGFTAAPFATDDGIDGSVVVFADISERKAAADGMLADLEKLSWVRRLQERTRRPLRSRSPRRHSSPMRLRLGHSSSGCTTSVARWPWMTSAPDTVASPTSSNCRSMA